mgnify:CR=1 FL=1
MYKEIGQMIICLLIGVGISFILLIPAVNKPKHIDLPEEFKSISRGDTLTCEIIDNTTVLGFYHGYIDQRNKQLLIVK